MSEEKKTNEPLDEKEPHVEAKAEVNKEAENKIEAEDEAALISEEESKEEADEEIKEVTIEEELPIENVTETPSEVPAKAPKKPAPQKNVFVKKPKGKQYLPEFPYSFKSTITVLGIVALLIFLWSIIFHPSMRIEAISVNGNYELSDSEIMDALDIHVGDHIWTFTGLNRRALIRSTPYIQNIQVQVDFPSHINVNVTERHKLAYIKTLDGYIAIDAEGTVLEFVPANEDVSPVLCGLDVDNAVLGRTIDITDSLPFRKLILVLGAILDAHNSSIRRDGYSFFDSVQEVRIVPSGMIFVTVSLPDGTELQVKLAGIEDIAENMQWLLYSIRGGAFDNLPAGSLDMTQEEKIYHAYDT